MESNRKPGFSPPPVDPGLCGRCGHVRQIHSAHGSTFYLCEAARQFAELPRYPRLPVLRCSRFALGTTDGA